VIGREDAAHVLGIEPGAQSGRTNKVTEHHRQLTPLGGGRLSDPCRRPPRERRCRDACPRKLFNRRQHPAAMPYGGDAELLEVIRRQFSKNLQVDGILAKRSLILIETKPSQPIANVHGLSPTNTRQCWSVENSVSTAPFAA
jgi:hypothetical protein